MNYFERYLNSAFQIHKKTVLGIAIGIISIHLMGLLPSTLAAEHKSAVKTFTDTTPVFIPWYGYIGMEGSYLNVSSDFVDELKKSGFEGAVKGYGSYYLPSWVLDMGGGFSYSQIKGEGRGNSVTISTRSGFLDFSPRFRFGENWQLGPVLRLAFGTDLTYSETVAKDSTAVFAGLTGLYEWMSDTTYMRYRIGPFVLSDLSVSNRSVLIAGLQLQIGLPFSAPKSSRPKPTSVLNPVTTALPPTVAPEDKLLSLPSVAPAKIIAAPLIVAPRDPIGKEEKATFAVVLDREVTFFNTASSKLSPRYARFLRRLGKFLKENATEWDRLRVEGHTDIRGKLAYNIKLSNNRAAAVRRELVAGGAPAHRLITRGYGPKVPVDRRNSPDAWAKNRRVEINFLGPVNSGLMKEHFTKLKFD